MNFHIGVARLRPIFASLRKTFGCALTFALLCAAIPSHAAIPQAERDALVNLYNATQGPLWSNRAGWLSGVGTECYWTGVTCDATQSTVIGLNFANNNMHGTLTALTPFANLVQFDASQNSLTGTIPALTGLSKLQVFDVFGNQLSGSLPPLTGLVALQEFRVWNNQLSGSIPSLADATQLLYFDAQSNQLSGSIPVLTQSSALQEVIVSNNLLSGGMPDLTGLASLRKLDVSFNQLTGAVSDLSTDSALQTLYIDHNNLSGALPAAPASLAVATVCPNAALTQTPDANWNILTGQTPWYLTCAAPAKLVVTNINNGVNPAAGAKFSITAMAQDTSGAPAIVNTYTYAQFSLVAGSGQLYSQSSLQCTIPTGGSSCTLSDASYSIAESGVRIQASAGCCYSGPIYSSPVSAPFTVVPGTYTIGGTVSGLTGSGLVLSLYPGSQRIPISSNGVFAFPLALGNGAYYSVSVASSPSSPLQQCTIQGAAQPSGNIAGANVTNIQVSCVPLRTLTIVTSPNGNTYYPTQIVTNGASASFYLNPNYGYRAQISAKGCTVTKNSNNGYTTSPLYSDCAISVTFVPLQYVPLAAIRMLDTRPGKNTVDGAYAGTGTLPAKTPFALPILGRGGVPTTGVSAVVLNVTVSNTNANPGFLTGWPSCVTRPVASNLNYTTGQTISNLVIVAVGCDTTSNFFASTGSTDVVVDLVGYFTAGSGITSLVPSRLLDTRPGATTFDGVDAGGGGPLPAKHQLDLTVTGRAGIPAGALAVAMNVTATNTMGPGFVTAWPTDLTRPVASNLNFVANQTIPNLVIAKLSAQGQISLYNSAPADLIGDAVAWFPASSDLTPLTPARLVDTRAGASTVDGQSAGTGQIVGGGYPPQFFQILGRGGVPSSNVNAVVLNVTATNPTAVGSLTIWSAYSSQPSTTNVNFQAGQTIPNLVIVGMNANYCCQGGIYVAAPQGVSTDVIVDVVGWFVGPY